ncbi:hypothetical protein PVL29_021058 [Vitis rotundifolia]|uniref:Protein jagunal homolog 1-like n=1 Tax=Vitis rotundifolia TaxID=103349 RepID=A0AA38YYK2_VITRO|nr:hypothetical protein PVL29_021058 [Vitis rotundifolia]
MQQRKSASSFGRPSGTDGSDFSYRMVVDSRYRKVAKGKSRLHVLIIAQAIIQLIGGLSRILLSTSKEEGPDKLAIATVALGFISLIIGELGQRRSRVNFLRLYMITASIGFLLSTGFVVQKNSLIEVLQDMSGGEMKLFELLQIGYVVLGFLVQISTISTIITLIWNMSPPKRAS